MTTSVIPPGMAQCLTCGAMYGVGPCPVCVPRKFALTFRVLYGWSGEGQQTTIRNSATKAEEHGGL